MPDRRCGSADAGGTAGAVESAGGGVPGGASRGGGSGEGGGIGDRRVADDVELEMRLVERSLVELGDLVRKLRQADRRAATRLRAAVGRGEEQHVVDHRRQALHLLEVADQRVAQRFDRTLEDVFALQDEIAHTIVDALRATTFADLSEPLPQRYAGNATAYSLYLKGRFEWNKRTQEGVAAGIRYFEEAVTIDPRYAPAYVGLADSYALHVDYRSVPVTEGFERAKAYARKAIELDESLAEAHAIALRRRAIRR